MIRIIRTESVVTFEKVVTKCLRNPSKLKPEQIGEEVLKSGVRWPRRCGVPGGYEVEISRSQIGQTHLSNLQCG